MYRCNRADWSSSILAMSQTMDCKIAQVRNPQACQYAGQPICFHKTACEATRSRSSAYWMCNSMETFWICAPDIFARARIPCAYKTQYSCICFLPKAYRKEVGVCGRFICFYSFWIGNFTCEHALYTDMYIVSAGKQSGRPQQGFHIRVTYQQAEVLIFLTCTQDT